MNGFQTWFMMNWSIIWLIPGLILGLWAQSKVSRAYREYSLVRTKTNINATQAANSILAANGVNDVHIVQGAGELTDHYNPRKRTIQLSTNVYDSPSVAAVAIAAHECGHAIQHAKGYFFLRLRNALVPIVNFGSAMTLPLLLLGIFFSATSLIDIAVIVFAVAFVFQLVTLPVETNASKRALLAIESQGIVAPDELHMAKKVLSAAALTYVAAMVMSLLNLMRFMMIARRR